DTAVSGGGPPARQKAFMEGFWHSVRAFNRFDLEPDFAFRGPALVFEKHCSTVVNGGWSGKVDAWGCLVLSRGGGGRDGK
ncbi:MAG: hypothetical protein WBQ30_18125, partial [Thermoanaerobaculia bacterium]